MFTTALAACVLLALFGWFVARSGAGDRARKRINRDLDFRTLTAEDADRLRDDGFACAVSRQLLARRSLAESGRFTVFAAWLNGKPVGIAAIDWDGPCEPASRASFPDCPEIHSVEVEASLRSSGVGSRLIAVCEGMAVERGFPYIGVAVDVDNVHAYSLYLRLGYSEPRRVEFEAPPANASPDDDPSLRRFLVKTL